MRDKFFLDSNVCLYILDSNSKKFEIAKGLLMAQPTISTQVILENVNVCVRKFKKSRAFTLAHAESLQSACRVQAITPRVVTAGLSIFETYEYSIFDSLIIASAWQSGCSTLYSEDLQHGQLIADRLRIVNPFR